MKTVKSLIIFAAFLIMAAVVVDLYFLLDIAIPNKNAGAYIGVGAMVVLLIALIFISFTEKKIRKLQTRIEEKDQEIGRLQKSLEQTNDVINIMPDKEEDIRM